MKNWEKEFDKKFVEGYGDGLVDWTYPEEGNVIDFIQNLLDKEKENTLDLIVDEMTIAHKKKQPTDRLKSLYNKLNK